MPATSEPGCTSPLLTCEPTAAPRRRAPQPSQPKIHPPRDLALVDTCILFRAIENVRLGVMLRKRFVPCVSDTVESEFEHLCKVKQVPLSSFLRTWAWTRAIHDKRLGRDYTTFLATVPASLKAFLDGRSNDARIGFAAYKHDIKTIITDNVKDFSCWASFGITILGSKEVLATNPPNARQQETLARCHDSSPAPLAAT